MKSTLYFLARGFLHFSQCLPRGLQVQSWTIKKLDETHANYRKKVWYIMHSKKYCHGD